MDGRSAKAASIRPEKSQPKTPQIPPKVPRLVDDLIKRAAAHVLEPQTNPLMLTRAPPAREMVNRSKCEVALFIQYENWSICPYMFSVKHLAYFLAVATQLGGSGTPRFQVKRW